jgi:cell filamentation protein
MYETEVDPYCYPDTSVLKNRPGFRNQSELDKFEAVMVKEQSTKPLPTGSLSVSHYRAIHRHLFGPVYVWAGRYRTVRMRKGESDFCYPEYIQHEMKKLFTFLTNENFFRDLPADDFARKAAKFLTLLNAIHPFREGNGRTQNTFLDLLSYRGGHPLVLSMLEPTRMLEAMIAGFNGDEQPLSILILTLMRGR